MGDAFYLFDDLLAVVGSAVAVFEVSTDAVRVAEGGEFDIRDHFLLGATELGDGIHVVCHRLDLGVMPLP